MKRNEMIWNAMKWYEMQWILTFSLEMHFPKKKLTFSSDGKWIDDTKASTMTTKLFAYVVKKSSSRICICMKHEKLKVCVPISKLYVENANSTLCYLFCWKALYLRTTYVLTYSPGYGFIM